MLFFLFSASCGKPSTLSGSPAAWDSVGKRRVIAEESFYLKQAERIKQETSISINKTPEEVPFDLGFNVYVGKDAASITQAIPVSIISDREKYKQEVADFFAEANQVLGKNTKFYVNEFAINTEDDFGKSAVLTEAILSGLLPFVDCLIYYNTMAIGHLGENPDFFPNTFFGESPKFNLGASFFALNATLMNI